MKCFVSLIFCTAFTVTAHASQFPIQPECHFKARVKQISIRAEEGKGISHGEIHKYIDLKLDILKDDNSSDPVKLCRETIEDDTFQMPFRRMWKIDTAVPKVGDCIEAKSRFSGDGNFTAGNWLTVIQKLSDDDACLKP